jgi:hypothetical protein
LSVAAATLDKRAILGSFGLVLTRLLASLTTFWSVGTLANVKAELLQRDRFVFDDGAVVEMVIWSEPTPVPGSAHRFKYRLH